MEEWMNPLVLFLALISLLVIIPLRWQNCIKIVLYLVVLEGVVRKWILPGAADLVYFAKDFIALIAYIKFFFQPPKFRKRFVSGSFLKFVLLLSAIIPIVQIANPENGSVLIGLFGIRGYVFYMPLVFLVPSLFDDKNDLLKFLLQYLYLVIPVVFLALVQYASPANSFINRYATEEVAHITTMGTSENVRATGTFPYITGFGVYLSICIGLILPFLTYKQAPKNAWLSIMIFFLTFVGFLTTGSRGPLFYSLLLMAIYIIININFWRLGYYKKILPIILFCVCLIPIIFPQQLENFVARVNQTPDMTNRLGWIHNTVIKNINNISIFGFGVGTCHPANAKIRKLFNVSKPNPVNDILDIETGRIYLEIGLLGLFLWYFMRIYLVYALWRVSRQVKTQILKDLALVAFLIHFVNLTGSLVYNVTFLVYYWFLAGFILLLPQLDYIEELKQQAPVSPKN